MARENPALQGVIDITDFNATTAGQRIVDDGRLAFLVQVLNNPNCRLGLADVEPDILGRAYEYLLWKFAESQGQSAGEFYTPMEVGTGMIQAPDKVHRLDSQTLEQIAGSGKPPTVKVFNLL